MECEQVRKTAFPICYLEISLPASRNPMHRIIYSVPFSGSTKIAFNDITLDDPDFGAIQGEIYIEDRVITSSTLRKV